MWRAFTNGKPSKNTRIMQLRMECTRNIKYRVCSPDEEGKSHRGGRKDWYGEELPLEVIGGS